MADQPLAQPAEALASSPTGQPTAQDGGVPRLSEAEVAERLTRLEHLLDQVEQVPGPGSDLALEAVATLTAVYGEALGRVMALLGALPEVTAGLVADDLVGHLLVLHGLSPVPAGQRIATALAEIRPVVQAQGADVRLAGVDGGVARVELSGHCGCSGTPTTVRDAIEGAILGAAPELTSVQVDQVAAEPEPTLIPVDAVLRSRPVSP